MDNPSPDSLQKILDLTKKRIDYFYDGNTDDDWYRWSEKYFEDIIAETEEASEENCKNNHVFLEDELGDIFWNFCCLLSSLEREGKISERNAVFRRAYAKFSQRIGEDGRGGHNWDGVKEEQKIGRKMEHESFYGNDIEQ